MSGEADSIDHLGQGEQPRLPGGLDDRRQRREVHRRDFFAVAAAVDLTITPMDSDLIAPLGAKPFICRVYCPGAMPGGIGMFPLNVPEASFIN